MGLPTDLRKGDSPHRLNRMENLGKRFDVHPPLSYYEPQSMAEHQRVALERWHVEVRTEPFDFDQQLSS